jgi:glycine cleavage system transcriptional repressor
MELAVTVIGRDRPGIVADVAEVLSGLGANLTDSTMTRLRGHFTMTLVCSTSTGAEQVEAELAELDDLVITVRDVGADEETAAEGVPYVLSLHGADRLGIVAAVTRAVAVAGGNITDLSTRLIGPLYLMIAEVDLPPSHVESLNARLAAIGDDLGVEISLRPAEVDVL